jgi:endonuclease-3
LMKKYPRPRITLTSGNPWELLVATILSAQCTDKRVNIVAPGLFKKFKSVADTARADQKVFERAIRSTGFYRNKAKNIIGAAKKIKGDFKGRVPQTMEELLTLPGVARKTANVVLHNAFGKNEGIAVDTHVMRISQRLGLTKRAEPVKIEQDLMRMLDKKEWGDFSLRLIAHGRETCFARKPQCAICVLARLCPSRGCCGGTA